MNVILVTKEQKPCLETSIIFSILEKLNSNGIKAGIDANTKLLKFYRKSNYRNALSEKIDTCIIYFRLKYLVDIACMYVKHIRVILIVNSNVKFPKYLLSFIGIRLVCEKNIGIFPDQNLIYMKCSFPDSLIYKSRMKKTALKKYLVKNDEIFYPVIKRKLFDNIDVSKIINS